MTKMWHDVVVKGSRFDIWEQVLRTRNDEKKV
jgi:hypothetical protein